MENEKFCLRWNDFERNISKSFKELRDDKDFFDVTLACDEEQIKAHKIILASCSPFFRNVLRRNPHEQPLLYLKGVKYADLVSVLNFMYHGEVNIAQEDLNAFLAVAEDLCVKGLTQNQTQSEINKNASVNASLPSSSFKNEANNFKHYKPVATSNVVKPTLDNANEVPIKSEPKEVSNQSYSNTQMPSDSPIMQSSDIYPREDHRLTAYQEEPSFEEYENYIEDQHYNEDQLTVSSSEIEKGNFILEIFSPFTNNIST